MLDYQVNYWKNEEQKRSNLANERLGYENLRVNQQQATIAAEQARIAAKNAETNRMNAETQRLATQYNYTIGQYQAKAALTTAQANWSNALTNIDKQSTYQQATNSQAAVNAQKIAESMGIADLNAARTELIKSQIIGQNISNYWGNANAKVGMAVGLSTAARNVAQAYNSYIKSGTEIFKIFDYVK